MNNVVAFETAAERIIARRLTCLRSYTTNYYRCIEMDGRAPFSFERFQEATYEIERLERTLNGVRNMALVAH